MIVYFKEFGVAISDDDILRKHGKKKFREFKKWMEGQTMPMISRESIEKKIPKPTEWQYYDDYRRWVLGLPVID
jgi:hypothetical protein